MADTEPTHPGERPGRNDPCHCGSGRKYKQCCLGKDEEADRQARAAAAAETVAQSGHPERSDRGAKPKRPTEQPWKRRPADMGGFKKVRAPRKIGSG